MLAAFAICLAINSAAQAQATRTWVSGVGDDVNPCSRTAPCKTYAGAISKTATGGEISTLDPGGFGAVTITKSITIEGTQGQGYGSILSAGFNGVIVNVSTNPTTAVVTLRNLSINGIRNCTTAGCAGIDGIRFLAGNHLIVENVNILGMGQEGIDVVHTVAAGQTARLTVNNTSITDTGNVAIRVQASNGGTFTTNLNNVRIHKANIGFDVLNGTATMVNSTVTGVTNQAVVAENTAQISVENSLLAHNGTAISAFSSGSTVRISGTGIYNNATSIAIAVGGTVASRGDNRVNGNAAGVAPNAAVPVQ
jgi:hypothetical protein